MTGLKVLIVEDDSLIVLLMKAYMDNLGHTVIAVCDNGPDACTRTKELSPDLVLMDIRLYGPMTGIEAARIIQKNSPSHILFVTANPHLVEPMLQDSWFHHCALISKPASEENIAAGIDKLFAVPKA